MSDIPILEEKLLKELLDYENLVIHPYQRPYKWKQNHVIQLLDDLYENVLLKKTSLYRVGSIILHQENEIKNVVDGQQRLTTFTLILQYLFSEGIDIKTYDGKFLFSKEKFNNEISKNNLKFNYSIIQNWFSSKSFSKDDLQMFYHKILERTEFVTISVYNIDEAFQLFDSQNSRGKALEPHDLLKAFHLREMSKDGYSEFEMEAVVLKWEAYLMKENKPLENILNQNLFRIRSWSKGELNYIFSKNDINEFKGISLNKRNQYNYELQLRIVDGFSSNFKNDRLLRNFQISTNFPYQISMPIINGKNFFDYIFYYIELKKEIFEKSEKDKFDVFYKQYCKGTEIITYSNNQENLKYEGSGRTGDEKVRNLFENICLLYVDRFGLDFFEKIYFEEFYKNAYQLRLNNKSINENSILKYEKAGKFFKLIPNTYHPEELHKNLFCNFVTKNWNESDYVKGVKPIFNFLTNKN